MNQRHFHDGREDGLTPLDSLDLQGVQSFGDLLRGMANTAFAGRQLGAAFEILLEMIRDRQCRVVLTVSGAMTVAKQGRIICQMIDRGVVDAVVATGALIAHGLTESLGLLHYRSEPEHSDELLHAQGYNRIFDTLEMEANLNDVAETVSQVLDDHKPEDGIWSSARFCAAIGRQLSESDQGPGILRSAYEKAVPVFIPAFTDSELGLDIAVWAMERTMSGRGADSSELSPEIAFPAPPAFNPFLDLQAYALFANQAQRLGIFTIGGGVPRNWAQQVGPFFEIANQRLGTEFSIPRFQYGVRICPEPAHWGGLSGCTYSEGVSWGKFVSPQQGGRYAEVHADATVVWPLLMKAIFEEMD